jgi:hypothetical protein
MRAIHHAIFNESRHGRTAEIVAWSNAAASLGAGAQAMLLGASLSASLLVAAFAFVLLRLALLHRVTVWIAAAFGTVAVAGAAGGVAWLFAHVISHPAAPPIAAAAVGVLTALVPTRAYLQLARAREHEVRDSLIDPVSARPSHR